MKRSPNPTTGASWSRCRALRLCCGYLFSSAGDGESTTDVVFSGHDMIYENGSLLAEAPPFGTGYAGFRAGFAVYCPRTPPPCARSSRRRLYAHPIRPPSPPDRPHRTYWRTPFVADTREEKGETLRRSLCHSGAWLKKTIAAYRRKPRRDRVSGGLDSAMALLVARGGPSIAGPPRHRRAGRDHRRALAPPRARAAMRNSCATRLASRAARWTSRRRSPSTSGISATRRICRTPPLKTRRRGAQERTQVLMDLANMCNGLCRRHGATCRKLRSAGPPSTETTCRCTASMRTCQRRCCSQHALHLFPGAAGRWA